jgi:hypothetical protein
LSAASRTRAASVIVSAFDLAGSNGHSIHLPIATYSASNRGALHNNEGANHPISVTRPKNKVQVFRSDLTGR